MGGISITGLAAGRGGTSVPGGKCLAITSRNRKNFGAGPAGFVQRRVKIVAGGLRLVAVGVIGPVEEAEVRAAVQHIQVHRDAAGQEPVQFRRALARRSRGRAARPSGRASRDRTRPRRTGRRGRNLPIVSSTVWPVAAVDGRQRAGQASQPPSARAVRGEQRNLETGLLDRVADAPKYALSLPYEPYSFSNWTIRIGPPRVTCSGANSRPEALQVAGGGLQKPFVAAADLDVRLFNSQAGKPPKSHSAQAVWARPQASRPIPLPAPAAQIGQRRCRRQSRTGRASAPRCSRTCRLPPRSGPSRGAFFSRSRQYSQGMREGCISPQMITHGLPSRRKALSPILKSCGAARHDELRPEYAAA